MSSLCSLREYQVGIKHEKSVLDNFAEKYVIEGKPNILPIKLFKKKAPQIKDFLRNHRNIKIRMIMVCLMGQDSREGKLTITTLDKAYFQSVAFINLEGTNVKKKYYFG